MDTTKRSARVFRITAQQAEVLSRFMQEHQEYFERVDREGGASGEWREFLTFAVREVDDMCKETTDSRDAWATLKRTLKNKK